MTSQTAPATRKEEQPGAVGAGADPGTPGGPRTARPKNKQTWSRKTHSGTISNQTSSRLND
jgi:hypothetical protein